MKEIKVRYFAVLSEKRGLREEIVQSEASTVKQLYDEMNQKYRFLLHIDKVRFSRNNGFIEPDSELRSGDVISFLPPFAGG